MKRRGELSMEVIIIAAIALLILVVLTILILRKGNDLSTGTGCEGVGGSCLDECGEGYARNFGNTCSEGRVCCVSVDRQEE